MDIIQIWTKCNPHSRTHFLPHIGGGALPSDNVFRPDLASFDRFSRYATATRYPLPGGGMPRPPTKEFLDQGIKEVASLVDEIADYRRVHAISPRPK
jgi:hypothetical protein